MKKIHKPGFRFMNGLKSNPKDTDFHITPSLIFARVSKETRKDTCGNGWAIAIIWGHWALGFQNMTIYLK
jgi:hypothetical protein